MKPYLEVQKNRIAYHQDAKKNTVHRSSLMVPKLDQAESNITFINHFLIKRKIKDVTLKVTCLNKDGLVIDSLSIEINQPRVYSIYLDDLFETSEKVSLYLVEFFSSKNLFIPFPAVMINHVGKDFTNSVHSFNRVLNDIFEEDQINSNHVEESSVDMVIDDEYDSFFNLVTGPFSVDDSLSLSVKSESRSILGKIDISQNRLTSENYFLSNILKGKSKKNIKSEIYSDVLRVLQPRQTLFYGRLLSGIMNKKTRAFSANHSYYDSSLSAEYFSNLQSYRVYPYFNNSLNRISIYPVMSPSKINFHIEVYEGKKVYKSEIKTLLSPSNNVLKFEIDDIVKSSGFKDVSLYKVFASVNKGKIPTRVTHQLIYGPQHSISKLNCTIAINLANKDIFIPKTKTGLCWGQVLTLKNYNSYLGISFNDNVSEHHKVNVKFYGNKGLIKSVVRTIKPNHSAIFDNDFFSKLSDSDDFIWYIAKSERPDLSAKSFHYHSISHHASGEHSF